MIPNVRIVHDMLEYFVHFQCCAAFAGMENGSIDRERAGNLNAVDTGHRVCLFYGENFGTLLASRDGSHKSGAAAADHADVNIIHS